MKKLLVSSVLLMLLVTPLTAFALIIDPIGDAKGSYDVVKMDALFDSENLYIEAKFSGGVISHAPGEFIPGGLYGFIDLDIDQNFFTGDISNIDFFGGDSGLGVEYMIDLFSLTLVNTSTFYESLFDITWRTKSILVTISLTDLGDDGLVNYAGIFGDDLVVDSDYAPNWRHGTSAPVPEPSTMLLLGAGLIGFAGYTRKRIKK